jgi:Protein of unknown function (DUF2914)
MQVATNHMSGWQRLQGLRQRYAHAEHLVFFAGGFFFDSVMIRRIDDALVLIQQSVYLIVVGVILAGLVTWNERTPEAPGSWKWLSKVSGPVVHFMLGTLLNAYALFYVKSASGWSAALFVVVIGVLLVVNELPLFRRLGPVVLYALYSFCLTSYFAYLYPVLFGSLRSWMFLLAVATSTVPLVLLSRLHFRVTASRWRVLRQALLPSFSVQAALLALFLLRLLPPVPLSLMDIGIYHDVTREASGSYLLSRLTPPWWKPWTKDDTDFRARAGDRVYCFFRVFAPARFEDQVHVRWSYREPGRGWLPSDAVPILVRGGREHGFAGYTYKQNWRPGQWRVAVETADGREIGRHGFSVREDPDPLENRALTTDRR